MNEQVVIDEREQALIAARAVVASVLVDVAQSAKLLQSAAEELNLANIDFARAGGFCRVSAAPLLQAVKVAFRMLEDTDEGRAALGLPPMPTHVEQCLANARADVRALEDTLAKARAVVPNERTADDRRRNIESVSLALVRARKRLSEMEGGSSVDAFRRWLKEFSADVQRALREAPVVQRGGDGLRRLAEAEAAEAWRESPFTSTVSELLG